MERPGVFMRTYLIPSYKIAFELSRNGNDWKVAGSIPWILGVGIRWDELASGPGG